MRLAVLYLLVITALWAQDPGPYASTLAINAPRPLDFVAQCFAPRYGIIVNSEDPEYRYSGDIRAVAEETARTMQPGLGVAIPKGGRLEVRFPVQPDGSPRDVRGMLQAVADAANAQFPFAYRLEVDGDAYTFVPTKTRDVEGRVVSVPALLDRKVTISRGMRSIIEHAKLMEDSLAAETGFHVSCCQGAIAGVPWGMEVVDFEARDEPARSVLTRLMRKVQGRYHYLERCDPISLGRETWCFVNVEAVP